MSGLPAGQDAERLKALYEAYVSPERGGRPLEELLKCNDKLLKGAEGQRLRGHFTSYGLHPADCEDPILVADLMTARLGPLQEAFEEDVRKLKSKEAAVKKWEDFRDSPNRLPIIDILQVGAWTQMNNSGKIPERYYDCLNWLIKDVGMDVEGTDLAGYTALQHSTTCTPLLFDAQWSSTLLWASKDPISAINHRNRFGTTSMHECTQSLRRPGEEAFRGKVLRWLLERGANADIADVDGCTTRSTGGYIPAYKRMIEEFDALQVRTNACAFCRRGGYEGKGKGTASKPAQGEGELKASLRCGKCRARNYCSATCQKLDWPAHKKKCVASPTTTTTPTSTVSSASPSATAKVEEGFAKVKLDA